ncbi:hypothetical protein, partial [Maribacter sp.]|uniref:hypothetical protein n=1 Tax=Maribacter sp. TaxID=1897614 RepID=UPI0032994954
MTNQRPNKSLLKILIEFGRPTPIKKTLVYFILLFTLSIGYAQETIFVNGQYTAASLLSVISDIEQQTNYQFYFLE